MLSTDLPARRFSIRKRIFILAICLLLVSSLSLIVFIRDYSERAADRAFDRLLAASALTIAGAVQVENDDVIVELPFAAFAMFSGQDRVFYAVEDPDGRTVTGYDDLAQSMRETTEAVPLFHDVSYRGELVRVASVGRLISTPTDTGWVTIHVAETQRQREALAAEILSNAVLPVVALTLLAIGLVWFGISRMFAPLTQLEHNLRARRPEDLDPVDVPVPVEVDHLVVALNGFMARLRNAMERVSGLVAEAAHEVRTPLASIRAQAEVALEEQDPKKLRQRVARIHGSAVQASQLVNQLLMEATVSHRLDNHEGSTTSIAALVDEVVTRLDEKQSARVGVSISPAAALATIPGDRVALREMLRNVVDNALTYSDGPIDIAVTNSESDVVLRVLDRGPGLEAHEKNEVMGRFKRGKASAGKVGSGLGLSIVARVVEAHKGQLTLKDRSEGGLNVEMKFPMPKNHLTQWSWVVGVALAVSLIPMVSPLAASTRYPALDETSPTVLTIVGVTDTPLFAHFIERFQQLHPQVEVHYEEMASLPLYEAFLDGTIIEGTDLIISSASDLQVKLANDGYALAYDSPYLGALPDWAHWRNEVFGFTFEPAVTIYNPDLVAAEEVPRTHLTLAELLEAQAERFSGRISTYDIALSGVGYLLAAQDQMISSTFWRLATAFGRVDAEFSGSSPAILNGVAEGRLALGFNVLGSYAFARKAEGANIEIVVPDDYVLVLTRSMFIPQTADHTDLAKAFVDFALSPDGQAVAAGPTALGSVIPNTDGEWSSETIAALGRGVIQPIPLGPGLLVSLDTLRRQRFLETWQEIVSPKN
ncbi:extracellular solute-binding protein [Devosia sp. MC521]|nr:extracellular solute-binding protein [Devosia sp. MC521]